MKKLGKRCNCKMSSLVVARACYCTSLCSCSRTPKATWEVGKAMVSMTGGGDGTS